MGRQTAAGISLSSYVSDAREVAGGNAQGSLYVEVECIVPINFMRQLKKRCRMLPAVDLGVPPIVKSPPSVGD
jgi:hypothetical protein